MTDGETIRLLTIVARSHQAVLGLLRANTDCSIRRSVEFALKDAEDALAEIGCAKKRVAMTWEEMEREAAEAAVAANDRAMEQSREST